MHVDRIEGLHWSAIHAMSQRLSRRTHRVAGPNSLRHIDGNHTLTRWDEFSDSSFKYSYPLCLAGEVGGRISHLGPPPLLLQREGVRQRAGPSVWEQEMLWWSKCKIFNVVVRLWRAKSNYGQRPQSRQFNGKHCGCRLTAGSYSFAWHDVTEQQPASEIKEFKKQN